MGKKVIITGANGFTGKYLIKELNQHGYCVTGTWHNNPPDNRNEAVWRHIDLLKPEECENLLNTEKPDAIIHLAAQNNVVAAKKNPRQTIENNILGTVNILEAAGKSSKSVKCILAGSAAVYDAQKCDTPMEEEFFVKPENIYAVTKVAQEQIAECFGGDYGMDIICTRPFNYSGYLQAESCFIPSLCRQVSEISKGKCNPVLTLGNLSVSRDFLDVRDVVSAYRLLLGKDVPTGTYNIASGKSVKLREIAEYLCNKSGMEIEIRTDPALVRKYDVPYICGNAAKLNAVTGWKPRYSVFDTVDWIYGKMRGEDIW